MILSEEEEVGILVDHLSQRLNEMRGGIIGDVTGDSGSSGWSAETQHFRVDIEFKRV